MRKHFTIGQKVVCWDRGSKPEYGEITELSPKGFSDETVRVHLHSTKVAPDRVWIHAHVYCAKTGIAFLRDDMENYSREVLRWSRSL